MFAYKNNWKFSCHWLLVQPLLSTPYFLPSFSFFSLSVSWNSSKSCPFLIARNPRYPIQCWLSVVNSCQNTLGPTVKSTRVTAQCWVTPGRCLKSSFKFSDSQAYNSLRHCRKPNVLISFHQYSRCDDYKCLWKHSVLFSLYSMSLGSAICPLSLSTNFTSFQHRKLYWYENRSLFSHFSQDHLLLAWRHLNFSFVWIPIWFLFLNINKTNFFSLMK